MLGTGRESGSYDEKRVRILEGDAGRLSVDSNSGGALEAAAADGDSGATSCGNRGRRDGADSQGNGSKLNNRYGGALACAVRGSNGEETLAIFVRGKKAAMEAVDIGHELLRQKNSQAEDARVHVEDVYAAPYSGLAGAPVRNG